jgi:hypothetical protein
MPHGCAWVPGVRKARKAGARCCQNRPVTGQPTDDAGEGVTKPLQYGKKAGLIGGATTKEA